ncbi:MAG: 23S rRNA pseudouridine synthase F [Parcubacteria group bacterium ADurb.Bin247]|jgi:23S rRNA pseudouridine2604 synthase|nr:MAG: 23S rRNA pseudouridine synthase F [Parcubacteria group bacterium ADurb.Bin247]HQB85035.1 S4 domain-containing protein [Candidatus Pacearchaeota archaeon]
MKKLQKFIADCGYCLRREAEKLIAQKQVRVNKRIAEIGMSVSDDIRLLCVVPGCYWVFW